MPDKTLLIIRINAKDMERLDETMTAVKGIKAGAVKDVRRDPIGFGVEVIKAGILIDSKDEKAIDAVMMEISGLPEVEDAEVEGMTLL